MQNLVLLLTNRNHHNQKEILCFFTESFRIYKVLVAFNLAKLASWVRCLYVDNLLCNRTDSHLILRPNVSITWSES